MSERKRKLYEYLIMKGDVWTSQAEIARELYSDYGNAECCLEPKDYHNTAERKLLSRVIQEINTNPEFQKIIITSSKGVKIANEAEFDRYIKNQYMATLRKLSRIYTIAKKGNRHNQIGIDGTAVEAFLEKVEEKA